MATYDPSPLFNAVDITGVVANALLGGAVARAHRFDIVGFVVLGVATGLGGGAVRDVLLGTTPVALTHPAYLPAAVAASCAAYLLDLHGTASRRLLLLADVLSVGCWSATGTSKALAFGLAWLPAIMVGVLTAIGGGIIRDVLVGRVPAVFGGNPLYATVAVVGSTEMLLADTWGRPAVGMAASIVTCGLLGVLARWRGWTLPGAASWNLRLPSVSGRALAVPARYAATLGRARPRRPAARTTTRPTRSDRDGPSQHDTTDARLAGEPAPDHGVRRPPADPEESP